MTVAIFSGEEGTGKTTQLLEVAKENGPAMWGIMEPKNEEEIMALKTDTFLPEILYVIYKDGHPLQGNEDPTATLDRVREWRDKIYKMNSTPKTIVIDGISDLRNYAIEDWIIHDNIKRVRRGEKPRESIGEKNIGAWGDVNSTVRKILTPLVNRAYKKHINFFMTAQMRDKYRKGDVVGTQPDVKPWMSYPVKSLFTMSYNEGYVLECTKEPVNPRWAVKNIVQRTGVLDALRTHNLIEDAVTTFMILYKEDGEEKREFVKASNQADAVKEFLEKVPEGKILEVTK